MKDFIFGTLATEELRSKHVRAHRAGVSHIYRRVPRDPQPEQEIRLELTVGPGYPCEQAWVYWTNDGSDPVGKLGSAIHGHVVAMRLSHVEWDTALWGYIQHFEAVLPAQSEDTIIRYYLSGITLEGKEIIADNGTLYGYYVADDPTPVWAQEAIVYQIFVDRFYPGKGKSWSTPQSPAGIYGGTIPGILDKLDYLGDLGINVVWLTPVFPSPSHHGYDATNLFDIEPRLGKKADLQKLIKEFHGRGIRILLDLVPNHVSDLHPAFQTAVYDRKSEYNRWFTFQEWPHTYNSFFDVPSLPQLNMRDPGAKKYMLDAAAYWLEMGVDGYRVDYAIGPAADFWADFRRVTRQVNPNCWTFGEVVEPPDSQLNFSGGLDGCLDFNLMEALRYTFAYGDWNAEQFASFVKRHENFFPESFSRPSFLDNHDMNRFLWAARGDKRRLRLAALCQFTLTGAPVVYYGTEVGLSQERDVRQDGMGLPEESRLPMLWGDAQDKELLEYYRKLIRLRKGFTAFRHGKAHISCVDENHLCYTRGDKNEIIVVLNLSAEIANINLSGRWNKVLFQTNPGSVTLHETRVSISPLGGAILSIGD